MNPLRIGLGLAVVAAATLLSTPAEAKQIMINDLDWLVLNTNLELRGHDDRESGQVKVNRRDEKIEITVMTFDPSSSEMMKQVLANVGRSNLEETAKRLGLTLPKVELKFIDGSGISAAVTSALANRGMKTHQGSEKATISKLDWALTVLNSTMRDWAKSELGVSVVFGYGPDEDTLQITYGGKGKASPERLKLIRDATEKMADAIIKREKWTWLTVRSAP
jgi:hypothetical protein